jgi:hypothetical protein
MARKRRSAQKTPGFGGHDDRTNEIPTADLSSGRWATMLSHTVRVQ